LRPENKKVKIKGQILKGAEDLFFHYGVKNITMDDIAKHLSISKRTIYENFPTKDDIVATLLNAHLEMSKEQCNMRCKQSKNAIEEIVLMMMHLREMFSRMSPRILFDLKKFHPKAWKQFQEFKQEFLMETISHNIKRGIKEGFYRKNLNVAVLARMRIEQVEIAWNPEIFPPSKYELKDVQLSMLDHFLYGITNIKGHGMVEKYKKHQQLTVLA
jgi:AcrR family transcriptional regulator